MLLEVTNLAVRYGKAQALRGVNLHVDEGEVVALIGGNGAGKTTLLRTISGLLHPVEGDISFEDRSIRGVPPHEIVRRGIAHVPEGRVVFGPMTVLDNLRVGAHLRRDKKAVEADLERMYEHFPRLKERSKQMSESLSGGEQQMLAVARALMSGPKLVLMDEPSMGLSPIMVEQVAEIVTGIRKTGISVLLVEQNINLALSFSDRAYVLRVGSIILEGPSREVAGNEAVRKAYLGA
jgi:branched-chain amino acid transport system ATP-binding protein